VNLPASQRADEPQARVQQVQQHAVSEEVRESALEPPAAQHVGRERALARAGREYSSSSPGESELPSAPRAVLRTPRVELPHRSAQRVSAAAEFRDEADWCRAVEFP
jgi:hypothetical protein